MGAYLSEPVTQKISEDEVSGKKKIICGSSSMQGWRNSQEDAHNSILDFDEDTSFFAVYDGHGGNEVSAYCAFKLPDYLKQSEAYKNGDLKKALIDTFLGFDKELTKPSVIKELKIIAGTNIDSADEEEEEEEVAELYQEATMSLDDLLKKYTPGKGKEEDSEGACQPKTKVQLIKGESERKPASPALRPKGIARKLTPDSSSTENGDSSNSQQSSAEQETKTETKDVVEDKPAVSSTNGSSSEKLDESKLTKNETQSSTGSADTSVSTVADMPSIKGKGKGKGKSKISSKTSKDIGTEEIEEIHQNVDKVPKRVSPRKAKELYDSVVETAPTNGGSHSNDSESDESDEDFDAEKDASDLSSDDAVNGGSGDDSDEYETVDEEEEEEPEEEEDTEFIDTMKHEPGSDSGCTAVVAILRGNNLYIGNAGDSRAVLCHSGKAIDLSEDHKPEDAPELARIVKAGGVVTAEGRVNGGLNLSRALGDHGYKQNKSLTPEEQMITCLPDVVHRELDPSADEFLILACDGIWNSMTSQEVIDFVRERIQKGETSMSKICEALFDSCISPNTIGDGTGCDNMSAVIVQLFKDPPPPSQATPVPEQSQTSQEGEIIHLKDVLHDSSTSDTNYTEDNSMDRQQDQDLSEDPSDRKRSASPVGDESQQKKQKTG